jgi:hypothetical protein
MCREESILHRLGETPHLSTIRFGKRGEKTSLCFLKLKRGKTNIFSYKTRICLFIELRNVRSTWKIVFCYFPRSGYESFCVLTSGGYTVVKVLVKFLSTSLFDKERGR